MSKQGTHFAVRFIRDSLSRWLGSPPSATSQLARWLQGYDLPPVGHDEEPYIWLLRAVRLGGADSLRQQLATRVAEFLAEKPDVKPIGKRPEQLLHNLFSFCAGLSCSEKLSDPLFEILQRRKLKGNWLGMDLRVQLRVALTHNQSDRRFRSVWLDMLKARRQWLPGNAFDGFEGILGMPVQSNELEATSWDYGKAVTQIAKVLKKDKPRRSFEMRPMLQRLGNRLSEEPNRQHLRMLELADSCQWPIWVVLCMPNLCFPEPVDESNERIWYVCWVIVEFLLAPAAPDAFEQVGQELCKKQVFRIRIKDDNTIRLVKDYAPVFERCRLENPYETDSASLGVILHAAQDVEKKIERKDPDAAKRIGKVRERRRESALA